MTMIKFRKSEVTGILFSISMLMILFDNTGSFTVQSIAIVIALLLLNMKKIQFGSVQNKMLLLGCAYTISLIYNYITYDSIVTVMSFIRLLYFYIIMSYFVICTSTDWKKSTYHLAINMYIITCVFVSLYIIVSYITGADGKISYTSLLGSRIDPNMIGAILAAGLSLIIVKAYYVEKKSDRYLAMACIFIIIIGMALTGCRAALVATAVSTVIFVGICVFEEPSLAKKLIIFFIVIIVALVLFYFGQKILPDFIVNRFFKKSYVDNSNSDRIAIWKNAISGWKNSPIFGYGIGNFSELHAERLVLKTTNVEGDFVAHNTYLDVLCDGGIVAFALFISLGIKIFWNLWKCKNKALVAVFINVFITSFIFGAGKAVYFWYMLILLYGLGRYILKNNIDMKQFWRKDYE